MEPELGEYYVKEAVKSIKIELEILRNNSLPDPKHVEGLISWIRFGVTSGKFTLEILETSPAELFRFSQILLTH